MNIEQEINELKELIIEQIKGDFKNNRNTANRLSTINLILKEISIKN